MASLPQSTAMPLYSSPPPLRSPGQDKPTLLVCWWFTLFCTTIILLRVCGRFIRTERLFQEDRTAALAVIPLFLRMGCVHLILLYGTNNVEFPPELLPLSDEEVRRRTIGSGLVLASRMLHAATYVTFPSPVTLQTDWSARSIFRAIHDLLGSLKVFSLLTSSTLGSGFSRVPSWIFSSD